MGKVQEDFIRSFCAAWGDGSDASRPDVDTILSMMTEDAEWQLWIPGGPIIKGKAALRAEVERQMEFATNNKCNEVNSRHLIKLRPVPSLTRTVLWASRIITAMATLRPSHQEHCHHL